MIVAACVEPQKLVRLRGAVGESHRLHVALDWEHADSIIRRQPVDVLVVDPHFGSTEPRTDSIRSLRAQYRSVPFVVYSVLAAQTLKPLIDLGRDGMEQLVLYGVDDDPRQGVDRRQPDSTGLDDRAAYEAPEHVTAPLVRRRDALRDEERDTAAVVAEHAVCLRRLRRLALGWTSGPWAS